MSRSVSIRNSFVHQLYAAEIDQQYQIFVQLPYRYAATDASYPVLYLLDGDHFYFVKTSIL